jgi:hypothetical protein
MCLSVDASLSTMRKLPNGGSAFTEEIAAVEKALSKLGAEETARILVASDAPRWLTPTALQMTPGNRDALQSMLRELKATDGGSDMALAIGEALQTPPAADRNARRIAIFTDATERPWHAADATRWRAIQKAVSGAALPTAIQIYLPQPHGETLTNLSISRLTVDHDTVAAGDAVLLTAEVRNGGTHPSLASDVIWQLDGKEAGRTPVPPLGSGVATTIEFSLPCGDVGSHIARASLATADDLPADSAAVVAIRTLDEIPVLVVDGGRRPNSTDVPETGFLLAALGHLPGKREGVKARAAFQPKIIDPSELSNTSLDPFFCVLLADVESVDASTATRLATHVAKGGGLWMTLGDRTNVENFNEVFSSTAIGLSPVQLGAPAGNVSETAPGWRVLPPTEPHPATMILSDTGQLDIAKARVQRHHTLQAPIPGNLTVLLKLENQAPLAIEHTFGKGRVFIQMAPSRPRVEQPAHPAILRPDGSRVSVASRRRTDKSPKSGTR